MVASPTDGRHPGQLAFLGVIRGSKACVGIAAQALYETEQIRPKEEQHPRLGLQGGLH